VPEPAEDALKLKVKQTMMTAAAFRMLSEQQVVSQNQEQLGKVVPAFIAGGKPVIQQCVATLNFEAHPVFPVITFADQAAEEEAAAAAEASSE